MLAAALTGLADAAARAQLAAAGPDWALLPARRWQASPARIPVAERWAAALTSADSPR